VRAFGRRRLLHLAWFGPVLLVALRVQADAEVPGLLFQGGIVVPPMPVVVDPSLPRGPALGWASRPETAGRSCAQEYPVCVHGGVATSRAQALRVLQTAFTGWTYVLNKPAPLGDSSLGGGPELDVYLTQQPTALEVQRDAPRLSSDQSSGFCSLDVGAITPHWLTLCVAEAASLRIDVANGAGTRRGWALHQIAPLVRLDASSWSAIDSAQANPQAPLLTRDASELSDAAALFWAYVDGNLGASSYGELPLAIYALARRQGVTSEAYPEWDNTPDVLDVFRRAFENDAQRIAHQLVNFAVWRGFLGSRSDAAHPPHLSGLGDLGRVRFDWVLAYSSLPRHVAGPYPLSPLGSAYIWVDLDSVPLVAELGFRAEWEQPVQFQWAIVRVDAQGRAMSQLTLPYLERATSVEQTLTNFQGAAGLLIVGLNLGGVDNSHPFDPDQEPWETHSYSIYLTELGRD
jgi:hypothetical protein